MYCEIQLSLCLCVSSVRLPGESRTLDSSSRRPDGKLRRTSPTNGDAEDFITRTSPLKFALQSLHANMYMSLQDLPGELFEWILSLCSFEDLIRWQSVRIPRTF